LKISALSVRKTDLRIFPHQADCSRSPPAPLSIRLSIIIIIEFL